jgi:hypothetical protein
MSKCGTEELNLILLGVLFLIRTTSNRMVLIRTLHMKYMEKKLFFGKCAVFILDFEIWIYFGDKK